MNTSHLHRIPLRLAAICALHAASLSLTAHAAVTRAADARRLSDSEVRGSVSAKLRGIVTSFSGWKNSFFLEDSTGGISVDRMEDTRVEAGDEVEVKGQVKPGLFAPILVSRQTRVLDHPGIPKSRRSTYGELAGGQFDSRLVQVTGVIQSAVVEEVWGKKVLIVSLHGPGGVISVHVLAFNPSEIESLIDSTVRITGVCGAIFNDRRQFVGLRLFASDLSQIEVLRPGKDPAAVPVTPLANLLTFHSAPSQSHLVHVKGNVTYRANAVLYLQEGGNAVRVESAESFHFQPGTRVEAWGFMASGGFSPLLRNAIIKRLSEAGGSRSLKISASSALKTESGFIQAPYDGLLVELDGVVSEVLPSTERVIWELRQGATEFQAQLNGNLLSERMTLEPGAHVKLTGICVADTDDAGNLKSFRLLLRSPRDIQVLSSPSWTHWFLLLVLIFLLVVVGSMVVWLTHRRKNVEILAEEVSISLYAGCQTAAQVCAAVVLALGLFFLMVWMSYGPPGPVLQSAHAALTPNGSLCLCVAALTMCINRRRRWLPLNIAAAAAGWLVSVVCVLTVVEYFTAWDFGIDGVLLRGAAAVSQVASGQSGDIRMGLGTAFCLLLASSAIALGTGKRFAGVGQVLAVATGILSLMNLVTLLYGHKLSNATGTSATMSIPTAMGLLLLSFAILLSRPDRGIMVAICASSPGGLMARRVIPIAILCPVVIGWIRLQGQEAGLYDTRVGLAVFAICNVVSFGFLVWSSAALLNRLEGARSLVQSALRDRERKLEVIFATGSIGDFTWDILSDQVNAHPSVWKLYGEPDGCGSAPGEWFRARQAPEDREVIAKEVEAALSSHRPFAVEFRVVWPDSTIRWIECKGTAVYGEEGSAVQVNGLNIDITDRKEAERRLKESETLFRGLADAMPQIVWTADAEGKVTYLNRRWYEYTGLESGLDWRAVNPHIIHPEDAIASTESFAESLRDGRPYEFELRLKRAADESYRWHLARAVPIRDDSGNIDRWFGTSTDVDDFKRASSDLKILNESLEQRVEERSHQLAEFEGRYRQLVENVKDYAIYMLDAEGRIATWNIGAERITGHSSAEVIGSYISIFYCDQDLERGLPAQELAVAAIEGQHHREGLRRRGDGSAFDASVLLTAIRAASGEVTGFSTIVRDMTEQKQAERLLMSERKRAEEASQAKSNFLAAMSHEIRTPMNAILGMADLLWDTDLEHTQREYVRRFRRAGTNLLTLINDILDLSKIESGRFELEHVEFNLHELLDRTFEMMEPRAKLKGIELSTHVLDGTPENLIGDPARLQQVLINLVGNAVKFTQYGEISLKVGPHPDGIAGHLSFSVRDTGIGIPEHKLEAIFEDFTQAEDSTTRRFGGTGLGLGVCRRLVEHMGGKLIAQSLFRRGSTFSFDAFLSVSRKVGNFVPSELMDLSKVKILVIDDEPINRLILTDMCLEWGMIPAEAHSLSSACELLSRGVGSDSPFTLALLDMIMPEVNGLAALEKLRSIDPRLAVIITSSDDQPGDVTNSIAMGAAAYMLKPIRKAQLLSVVSTVLRNIGTSRPAADSNTFSVQYNKTPIATKLLVAEDSEDNRFLVRAYLDKKPYDLTFVSTGREALDAFSEYEFGLILMDVQMPVMDGLAATSAIRQIEREQGRKHTPIIALTANALVGDTERSKAAGCDAHLSKPISKERLLAAIESFLNPVTPPGDDQEEFEDIDFAAQLEELSRDYLIAKRDEVAQMRELLAIQDLEQLRILGHNLKGSGASFGFPELTSLGKELEEAAKRSDTTRIAGHVQEVESYVANEFEVIWQS